MVVYANVVKDDSGEELRLIAAAGSASGWGWARCVLVAVLGPLLD